MVHKIPKPRELLAKDAFMDVPRLPETPLSPSHESFLGRDVIISPLNGLGQPFVQRDAGRHGE